MSSIRVAGTRNSSSFEIDLDGQIIQVYEGETVATAISVVRGHTLDPRSEGQLPSRVFCGMGTCFQCLVTINDQPNCQACKTFVKPGMSIRTSHAD